jgi:hypothetical protein
MSSTSSMERASWVAADFTAAAWPRPRSDRPSPALQQLGIADDRGERRAQLVGDVADEIALQPLGLGQRRFAVGQRALQLRASVTSVKAIRVAPSGSGRDW